jgi:NAD(P)-dependent dehydrogenase (short-subunit alcohol dehydrogenase family)
MSRAILVTGASRGIGAATAHAFAARGDRVAVHYGSRRSAAEEVAAALPGDGHVVVGADLGDPEAVRAMVDAAAAALGGIDVLVNNAAIFEPHPIEETSYEEWQAAWRRTLDVNLVGVANATWCAVRHMPDGGAIVMVSSRGAFRGEPNHPAYGASKAGVVSLGQSLAGEAGERRRAESPLGRIATPQEIAAAIVYLASPEATMASGTVLDVNGASFLRM